jgi:ABC-type branched-subunit amino acid transport system substrate-binding protein
MESLSMHTHARRLAWLASTVLGALALGCDEPPAPTAQATAARAEATQPAAAAAHAAPGLKTDKGVDPATKTVRLGVLNDESGPAAAIGKPYAVGKRILAAQVNAGGSGILPDGWKVELVERDHGYNPQKAVQVYGEIKDDVLLIAHSFGTPNTLPLRPMLTRDAMIALPASLSSVMAEHRSTIPVGTSYAVESERAVDWWITEQNKAKKPISAIKAAIVYQSDDYGQDGYAGFRKAIDEHGIAIVGEHKVLAGQRDFDAIIEELKEGGATHVLLTILPSATTPFLEAAQRLRYKPLFTGNTPTWIDAFFDAQVAPAALFANYALVSGESYWGEDLPGMPKFLDAYEKYGKHESPPDAYVLASYRQGLIALELVKRAIEAGDATRAGVLAVVPKLQGFDAGGLGQAVDLGTFPYVTSTRVRVRKPDFKRKTWNVVTDSEVPANPPSDSGRPPAQRET